MPTYFQRPENALKRANEFIDVGKKQRALDALYDVIKSKKHRTWQKIHEPIMEKYLELCVELKKSHIAKEGLYQYKNICQQVNIKSLEDVVRNYLKLAEEKTEAAREESQQAVVDIDDLDNLLTPESLLLSAVSGEDTQDRTDRVVLTPWVKFLWESYRQCLELLRNNSRVEALYHDIARQAFKFCLKYTRKTEFRKLCESLRTHLGHIHKHQNQQTSINLNNPESQAMHLETRLVQLDSAINMELWQEAYKAIEDIHLLMTLSKKPPKPQLMANYYQKLALVFWKAGNYLFHASALHRLFHLSRELKKNLTQEEVQRMASKVLLATLSIPIPPSRNEIDKYLELDDTTIEKQRRLATLLSLPNAPTRASLIKDLVKYSVIQFVVPEIQNLYYWLEVEFHPLHLCKQVSKCFDFISESKEADIQQYMPALQDITIMRLLKQVSQVYQTIEFSRLASLAPFAPQFRLERLIVDAARTCDLQVRIDHRTRTLSFGTDLGVGQREDVPEGPYLQSMPSEQIRNQLIQMSAALHKTVDLIQPAMRKAEQDTLRGQVISAYRSSAKKEHQRILIRRQIIEERKEMLENLNVQREQEEQKLLEEQKRKIYEAEKLRLEREAEERDRLRRQEEHEKIQKMQIQERIEQLIKSGLGPKIFKDLDEEELRSLNAEDIMAKQVEQLDREKRELTARLKAQEKKVDYFARARRVEEIPLLQKQYEEQAVKDREFWDQQEQERIKTAIQERQQALEMRNRLCHMQADKNKFLEQLKASRMSVYEEKLSAFETMLEEERQKRLSERKQQRKLERKITRKKEKEEEEKRKKEEEARKELAKKKAEEDAAYKARLVKLEEIAAKQRAREREIEERTAKIAEESRFAQEKDRDGNERSGLWRGSAREDTNTDTKQYSVKGGWREREKERERSWRAPNLDDRSDSPTYGKSDREVDKEDGNEQNWRSRPTIADDFDKKKDDKGPPRIKNDNRVDEVRNAPEEAWRTSADDRRAPDSGRRGQFDDSRRAPPDDIRRGPSDDRDWRRDDRNQTPRDDRSWRRDDKRSRGPDDDWRRNDRSVDKDRRMPIRRDENKDWRFSDREPSRTDDKKWRKEDSFSRFDSDKGRRPLREQGDKDRIDDDDKSWRKDVRTPQKRNEDIEWQGSRERSSGLSKDRDDRDSVRDRDDRSFLRDKEDRGFGRERDDRNFLRDRDDRNSFRDGDDRNLLRDRDSFRDRDDRSSFRDRDDRGSLRDKEDRSFLKDREERGPLRDREERDPLKDREERGPLKDREERGPLNDRDDRGPIRDSKGSAFEKDRYPSRKIDDESLKEERGGRRSEGKRREVEDEEGWRTVKH